MGIFEETEPRTFSLTAAADTLRSNATDSLRDLVIWMGDPLHLRLFAELPHSARTGEAPIEHVFGMPAFEYFSMDRAANDTFNAAMTSLRASTVRAILEAYDFSSTGTLVDVGGGLGYMLLLRAISIYRRLLRARRIVRMSRNIR
jgi:hypothetical protein